MGWAELTAVEKTAMEAVLDDSAADVSWGTIQNLIVLDLLTFDGAEIDVTEKGSDILREGGRG